ncbi:MAG: glycoside hydrolase N-terminal domain-containing protein [Lachnospiraceae bacterium]|nr:glycoside hydrolase N-terminal domain-containing protein [Lachnospiraceae bacterium]
MPKKFMKRRRNMKFKKLLAGFLALAMVVTSVQLPAAQVKAEETRNALTLWYDEPASKGTNILSAGSGYDATSNTWQQQTLPIGNGDMGANVYGEIVSEHLTFNEKTLWTGGPSSSRPNYIGGNNASKGQNGAMIKQIQQAFLNGNTSQAVSWCGTYLVGDSAGYGAYQAWGDIYFDYKDITASNATNYVRDLDLTTAISSVSFTEDGTDYTREFFISHDDNVLVARLEADGDAKLNLDVRFPSKQGGTTVVENNNTLKLCGQVSDNQLKYASYLTVVPEGGTVTGSGSKLTVANATAVTVYLSAATDYENTFYNDDKTVDYYYRTGETDAELAARVKADVDAAVEKGYEDVKADHLADYQELFERMSLDLGQVVSDKTTDQLLAAYKAGSASEAEKRQLEVMLFQYGRYLTIACSREDSQLPSNLQGVWNCMNNPPWSSDYHMNVNLQMNYWPTYSTNLAECALPLINYVESLREPGRVTAAIYFGVESGEGEANGFTAHTQNTPFGWTCPGWSFDWGWSPAAVPWILQNCWEYYEFTGDVEFMEENIYPMLKEEAKFYDATLVRDADGKLVSAPSYSPETGPRTAGNTYEQSLTWQLYEDTITAAEILGVDEELVETWTANQADLKGPIEVGDDGQIKEWYNETTFNTDENGNTMGEGFTHRHISHMLGLFPGDLIATNEEWLEAARVSMNLRTDSSTGWGMGQRINTWARLGDGNRAHKLIGDLFKGGIYPNLWDSHSPFQIDGNFGMTSGVAEMLLQSNMGFIDLLPALPDAWADGTVEGIVARGNFEIDMTWENTNLTEATILSNNGGTCIVDYATIAESTIVDEAGKEVAVTKVDDTRVSFETTAGATYTIKDVPEKPLESLEIEGKDTVNLNVVNKVQYEAVYEPTFCAENGVTWSVDDKKVATIDENGLLTAKKSGTVVITATYKGDNKTKATKTVEVVWGAPVADEAFDWEVLAENAIANSEQWPAAWTNDGNASWAFDEEEHWWHSRYQNWDQRADYETVTQAMTGKPSANNPIWIQTGFDQVYYIDHIDYTPRGTAGIFKDYTVSVANLADPTATPTDDDFEVVKTGTLSGVTTTQTIQLDELVAATHIRITVTSVTCSGDGHIAAKKISIYGFDGLPANKEALGNALATAGELSEKDYTADSWAVLAAAVADGEAVFANTASTQEELDAAAAVVNSAIAALVEAEVVDEVVRLSGTTRYETGYKVADALKEELGVDKFDAVVVATGKNFADALAGSYLAVQKNAPIILTNGKDDNVAQLHEYIAANVVAGGKVYILGGDAAVPASVEAIDGYDVVRLSGKSRYETNIVILEEAGITGDEIIVATGKTFADSLSASAAKLPILLVKPGTSLNEEQHAIAETARGGKIYIIGGEGAVSADVAAELAAYGEVVRVSGKTRYETSVAVANTFFADVEEAVAANGKNFPDGLCGGPLAAAMDAPLILTADGKTDAAVDYMAENAIASGFVLGGTGALADESVVDVFALESADEIILK